MSLLNELRKISDNAHSVKLEEAKAFIAGRLMKQAAAGYKRAGFHRREFADHHIMHQAMEMFVEQGLVKECSSGQVIVMWFLSWE